MMHWVAVITLLQYKHANCLPAQSTSEIDHKLFDFLTYERYSFESIRNFLSQELDRVDRIRNSFLPSLYFHKAEPSPFKTTHSDFYTAEPSPYTKTYLDFQECPVEDGYCRDGGVGSISPFVCKYGTQTNLCGAREFAKQGDLIGDNSCYFANDGMCDDFHPEFNHGKCEYATDTTDCGFRTLDTAY